MPGRCLADQRPPTHRQPILPPSGQVGSGFTLLEVVAVLIILGVLGAIAANHRQGNMAALQAETEIMKGYLRYAQLSAMNSNLAWGLRCTARTYALQTNGVESTAPLPGENSATHTVPPGILLSASKNPIVFTPWGSPGTEKIVLTLTAEGANKTIELTKNTGFIP